MANNNSALSVHCGRTMSCPLSTYGGGGGIRSLVLLSSCSCMLLVLLKDLTVRTVKRAYSAFDAVQLRPAGGVFVVLSGTKKPRPQ
jgi:hypothetical protein